ncbi:dihydrofolate reductase [uncultured Metabacillus sp.]|uniref:dihydrofolate reductase n=1 Tax=uncultured Metabacillus sp. TaxID=2860135 RepID=UPI0026198DFE|nr:dihydrofolate reductase [uncultured Metabacillus sp.]
MTINLIACIDKSRGIGSNGSLLTKPPLDFPHFKKLTMGNIVVFGRSTFEEIGRPLTKRHNIVLSNQDIKLPNGVYHYKSVNQVLREYSSYAEENVELFICGGERLYNDFLPYSNKIYLTIVDHSFQEADRHFPEFSLDEWKVTSSVKNEATNEYPYDYYFVEYAKK